MNQLTQSQLWDALELGLMSAGFTNISVGEDGISFEKGDSIVHIEPEVEGKQGYECARLHIQLLTKTHQ